MSRQARVVAEGVPHHAARRGNNRQDIFLTDDDRRFYIQTLRENSEQFGLTFPLVFFPVEATTHELASHHPHPETFVAPTGSALEELGVCEKGLQEDRQR